MDVTHVFFILTDPPSNTDVDPFRADARTSHERAATSARALAGCALDMADAASYAPLAGDAGGEPSVDERVPSAIPAVGHPGVERLVPVAVEVVAVEAGPPAAHAVAGAIPMGIPVGVAVPSSQDSHFGQRLHPSLHAVSRGYGVGSHSACVAALAPDLPDGVEAWHRLRPVMVLYMASSVVMIALSPWLIFVSLPLGVLGVVASCVHLFENCRGRGAIVGAVSTIKVLAAVVATMNLVLAGILLLLCVAVADGEDEGIGALILLALIYAAHGALSLHVFVRAQKVDAAIHPVAYGVVRV